MTDTRPQLRRPEPTSPGEHDVRPAVSLRALRKVFGHGEDAVEAIGGIDLDVAPGEFVSVLGASGCGKSTLLSIVAGLEPATSGVVEVDGPQPALMFQESALFPWLTARENVEAPMRFGGVAAPERRARAEELLETVRLAGAGGRRVHELSGGQRQRVAMARALAQNARVLLMDEPFAALDAMTRDLLHGELTEVWQRERMAVVFVTHNVREAVRLGQRVVLLSSRPGRVARTWDVDLPHPRIIEDSGVGDLSREITARLREEISRHAHA
ncbi:MULTISPECIES: ABC transporter ATP-binding protein [Dermacoccus]|uniref:ABC transporter ATP-binding protein n=2 Tax=Dermacoccus TaxID=57495 RepID=A0A417Z8Z6_9MICO|nr:MULTISPECIES: ABC transporter ATP-binding protein [Dermacoccus]MBZ4497474.1 ABC transporter ATP-binding protein [Dermacoccus sp. Tok2021]QNK51787.1 ABC transporter ATP-binding protein [Dermacoccus sp. PAMC28757]RHW47124.1 ABC transporter ATP-binding protein [Dermacoccus abyssi]RYI21922.1 ABC transporter ATP-binding protein [Dermacoccus sp. 147Ba]